GSRLRVFLATIRLCGVTSKGRKDFKKRQPKITLRTELVFENSRSLNDTHKLQFVKNYTAIFQSQTTAPAIGNHEFLQLASMAQNQGWALWVSPFVKRRRRRKSFDGFRPSPADYAWRDIAYSKFSETNRALGVGQRKSSAASRGQCVSTWGRWPGTGSGP